MTHPKKYIAVDQELRYYNMATRHDELTWREKKDLVSEYNVISSVLVIKNKTNYLTIETYHSNIYCTCTSFCSLHDFSNIGLIIEYVSL